MKLRAFARFHLDIVDDRTNRHIFQRHRVARLHVHFFAGNDLVAGFQALRRKNIAQLAIIIFYQSNVRRPVRIVLQPLDLALDIALVALPIDDAITFFMPAATETRSDTSGVVTAARALLALGQGFLRLTLPQLAAIRQDQRPVAGRRRSECF